MKRIVLYKDFKIGSEFAQNTCNYMITHVRVLTCSHTTGNTFAY